ncbi:histidinol-phosphate transaminase [Actinomyces sp. B33]|uniref:histidinol-phosphate transaminase n=1 Tax=Actinomyces sp. B33 TaxID=2942131 RepID=UPI0023415EBB|nr:histidinol-phosphate transaminase [Actinomyces sp. B33]MDC4232332.1 histidinol-phosphate transaminase [Actinomyces sp. B33]
MSTVPIRPAVAALPRYVPGAAPAGADKLSSNEMPDPPSAGVLDAAARALARINRYPDLTAAPVREALAARFGVDADRICVGTGSSAILVGALTAVCAPGEAVVFPWRSFESYPIAVPACHGSPVPVPLAADGSADLDAMARAVTAATRAVIVCTPNNPTGTALSAARIRAFVEEVPPDVLVLVDEAYIDFASDPSATTAIPLIDEHPNVLVMRTFSKAHALAGARIGYAIGAPWIIAAVQAVLIPFGVSGVAQAAALASLERIDEVEAGVARIRSERDRMVAALRGAGFDVPDTQANFLFLPGRGPGLVEDCARAGLVVRPFPEGVRVTVGAPDHNDRFLRAVGVLP